jgi:FtsH-binding integral membrane protein
MKPDPRTDYVNATTDIEGSRKKIYTFLAISFVISSIMCVWGFLIYSNVEGQCERPIRDVLLALAIVFSVDCAMVCILFCACLCACSYARVDPRSGVTDFHPPPPPLYSSLCVATFVQTLCFFGLIHASFGDAIRTKGHLTERGSEVVYQPLDANLSNSM